MAAGGFHPRRVLPVVMDVGTANPKLQVQNNFTKILPIFGWCVVQADPRYLGDREPRLEGEEYYSLIGILLYSPALC